ncbi:hypothetical protein FNU76_21325 [Chitinimonas arctica]|uniref:Gluconate 2-dehydrogenase subunit 3 family protein n=1 Tax=Chitinimonas arctica TaxID=2594795 RepID=A0A516SKK3_9NEIS|nr:hypothetical protein [Chitinimonas arctica]QDQ28692.1 hypothetical protein FNU76_21325 [Chitinimonas arctica]
MLNRRQLLKTGLAGAALLAFARLAYGPVVPDRLYGVPEQASFKVLDAEGRTALAAIARVMLKGALPHDEAEFETALYQAVRGCDSAIAGLPGSVQTEVKELLTLLNGRLTRRWLVGVGPAWEQASDEEVSHFLNRWRFSSLSLLRSGYQALHQIVFAAWYGNPQAWVGIAYDGPPEFMKGYWNA